MIVNYVPGEECRVAIVETASSKSSTSSASPAPAASATSTSASRERRAAIQAAFVDFGVGENGFLHVSDLHPRYFPGEERGDDRARRPQDAPARAPAHPGVPPRGDEVIVQVLKEGVGTKGPTLTSYLSIPGRFLVMMPQMDRVGVSRKVEDEDQRRADAGDPRPARAARGLRLHPPHRGHGPHQDRAQARPGVPAAALEGHGAAPQSRGKPRLLYSESDLLVRSLRDHADTDINEVVIDNDRRRCSGPRGS
jgi:ribonuclease E